MIAISLIALFVNWYNNRFLAQLGDKTDCNDYGGISLVDTCKMLSNILFLMLTPCVEEIFGDHRCGFRRNRSTTDQIFCFLQILEKKYEHNGTIKCKGKKLSLCCN
jgi:hypothetical protein